MYLGGYIEICIWIQVGKLWLCVLLVKRILYYIVNLFVGWLNLSNLLITYLSLCLTQSLFVKRSHNRLSKV